MPIGRTEFLLETAVRFRTFCCNSFSKTQEYFEASPVSLPVLRANVAYFWGLINCILEHTGENSSVVANREN